MRKSVHLRSVSVCTFFLSFLFVSMPVIAGELSGTLNLADLGVTFDGVVFNGIGTGDRSGDFVSNAGDMNGDGVDDLLISARRSGSGGNGSAGTTYLVYGKSGEPALTGSFDLANADVTFDGIDQGDHAGAVMSNAGDINGDGVDDLLIGAWDAAPNGNDGAGETYLIYGKSGASALSGTINLANADVTFNGIDVDDWSGGSVSNAGDINGDGIDDLLIGGTGPDPNGNNNAGETYLVYGKSGASALSGTFDLANADVTFNGIDVSDFAGRAVSNAGDVNGDGIDDLIIGASGADGTGNDDAGEAYLVYGKSGASALSGTFDLANADVIFTGIDDEDFAGRAVSNAGDVNGDGIDDLLIGAYLAHANGNIDSGETYLIYGKSGAGALSGTIDLANADVIFTGIEPYTRSGFPVSNAGDINGDGIDDLLIAAHRADPNGNNGAGETYLVYGKSGVDTLFGAFDLADADVIFNGIDIGDQSGWSVSNAGDVNGDGFDDLLIGADSADPNSVDRAGETYLVYGNRLITEGPTVDFIADGAKINPGAGIGFTDLTTELPQTWDWDFGAGESGATEQNPLHQYNTPGLYDVRLTATNVVGSDSLTKLGLIEVVEASDAFFTLDRSMVSTGEVVNFIDLSNGFLESWSWVVTRTGNPLLFFQSFSEQNPSFVFDTPGAYDVYLRVNNTLRGDGSSEITYVGGLVVNPIPEPGTLALLGAGLAGLASRSIRRKKAL